MMHDRYNCPLAGTCKCPCRKRRRSVGCKDGAHCGNNTSCHQFCGKSEYNKKFAQR